MFGTKLKYWMDFGVYLESIAKSAMQYSARQICYLYRQLQNLREDVVEVVAARACRDPLCAAHRA